MAKVEIVDSLYKEIDKKFKQESIEVLKHLKSLEKNPNKGKLLGNVAGTLIKELRYKSFRFYFIVDKYKLKLYSKNGLIDLLLRFVRMSNKKLQQKTIEEIREVLLKMA
ncbi:MAG: hypothetical protein ABH828_06425 [archaeon]